MESVQERAKEAWRRFVSVGALDDYLLRPDVFRAWERCHLLGANPWRVGIDKLSANDTARLLDANASLLRAAHPFMQALSWSASGHRHAVMLADRNAVMIGVRGDPASVTGPEAVPGPGALLAEAFAGANGIGTPIAARAYVELARTEHFIGSFHPFTCQGIPIYGSDGDLVGSISLSLRTPSPDPWMRALLFRAAKGIQSALIAARLKDELKAVLAEASPTDRAHALTRLRTALAALDARGPAEPSVSPFPVEPFALEPFAVSPFVVSPFVVKPWTEERPWDGDDPGELIARARAAISRYERRARIGELACRGALVPRRVPR